MPPQFFDLNKVQPYLDQGYTLLTPNQRLARAMRSAWDARQQQAGLQVWEPLAVYSLEQWLTDRWREAVRTGALPSKLVLSRSQQLLLWQEVITRPDDEQAAGLIHPSAAADHASQARERLLLWQIPLQRPDIAQRFSTESDCRTFSRWLQGFDKALAQGDWVTRADCLTALASIDEVANGPNVALVGYAELAPLERGCLEQLCEQFVELPLTTGEGEAVVHPFAEQRQELASVAAWAAQIYRSDSRARVGIVLADTGEQRTALEYLLRREFECLGEDYYSLPVNFSTGIGLSRAPVVRDALLVLETLLHSISVQQVVDLLHSRFLNLPDAGSALGAWFIRDLYRRGSEQLDSGALRNLANNAVLGEDKGLVLGQHLLAVSGMREMRQKAAPSEWIQRFNQVLDTWGWPGNGELDSLEYQQVQRWYQTLDALRELDDVCGELDANQALRLLRQRCDEQVSHPQTADSRVQVLGPLEAVGLTFDHLWVCGVQGGAWPSPPRPNPFIPLAIQSQTGMPHATPEREWQYSETLLRQFRAACAVVHVSYSRLVNGAPELPSGLIEHFQEQDIAPGDLLHQAWHDERSTAGSQTLNEESAPAVSDPELLTLRGGSSLLEHQSQCPFRAFAQHRLGAESLGEFGLGVSASERGQVVHEGLQYLWTQIDSHQALLALNEATRDALVRAAAEAGIDAIRAQRRQSLGHACLELERERLEKLLLQWMAVEQERGEFAVTALEQPVKLQISRLQINLRVDRIDQLPDGRAVIVDYKTGRAAVKDWLGERPAKPQLLLYGLAAPELPAALSFAQVRPDDCAYVGIGDTDSIPGVKNDLSRLYRDAPVFEDWQALNEQWQATLQGLAQAFVDGQAQVDPLPNSCTWCGLQGLCRVNDNSAESAEVCS